MIWHNQDLVIAQAPTWNWTLRDLMQTNQDLIKRGEMALLKQICHQKNQVKQTLGQWIMTAFVKVEN